VLDTRQRRVPQGPSKDCRRYATGKLGGIFEPQHNAEGMRHKGDFRHTEMTAQGFDIFYKSGYGVVATRRPLGSASPSLVIIDDQVVALELRTSSLFEWIAVSTRPSREVDNGWRPAVPIACHAVPDTSPIELNLMLTKA
jgi:hypothetical protein